MLILLPVVWPNSRITELAVAGDIVILSEVYSNFRFLEVDALPSLHVSYFERGLFSVRDPEAVLVGEWLTFRNLSDGNTEFIFY